MHGHRFRILLLCALGAIVPAQAGEFLLGGIQIDEPDVGRWVETLDAVGMNTVSITVYARQGIWNSADLTHEPDQPGIVEEIREAKRRGLHVVLILRVALDHAPIENRFFWHGMIMPDTDADLVRWFERYADYVLHWAAVAEREGVDVLGIGSELKTLTATRRLNWWRDFKLQLGHRWYQRMLKRRAHRFADAIRERKPWLQGSEHYPTLDGYLDARYAAHRAWARQVYRREAPDPLAALNRRRARLEGHWFDLIHTVRQRYAGRVTYAANFDNYHHVGFWNRLDLIGINAYFPLRNGLDPTLTEEAKLDLFEGRWRHIFSTMRRFIGDHGLGDRAVLFTELGYTSRAGSTVEPWAYLGFSVVGWKGATPRLVIWKDQPIDYEERRLALEALWNTYRTGAARPLDGLLYWKLSTRPDHVAIEPFVMHVGPESTDRLQQTLLRFVQG